MPSPRQCNDGLADILLGFGTNGISDLLRENGGMDDFEEKCVQLGYTVGYNFHRDYGVCAWGALEAC